MAAAPAPLTTTRIVSIFFPLSSRAFSNPAAEIMAVPCWSSCITGISSSSLSRCSISKHSGALISSRFIPPKVGGDHFNRFDEFIHVFRVEFDVKHVDVREYFKQ